MSEAKRYRVTHPVEYESRGETRTRWVELGSVWMREDGSMSGEIDCLPVGVTGPVRIMLFRADDRQRQEKRAKRPEPEQSELDDDIPF